MTSYFTAKDVADRYGVKLDTVWTWIKEGKLSGLKISNKFYRFSAEDLAAFEERQRIKIGK